MTSREQFETWFRARWPEFDHPTDSAFEVWQAARAQALEEAKQLCLARESRVEPTGKGDDSWFIGLTEGTKMGARHCACEIDDAIRSMAKGLA